MEQDLQEEIQYLQESIKRIDGKDSLFGNIGNRVHGILELGIATMGLYTATKYDFPFSTFCYTVGAGFAIDGLSALLTGSMHYTLFRITKTHPKYKLEKLLAQSQNNLVNSSQNKIS
jgi:hypothetical protein